MKVPRRRFGPKRIGSNLDEGRTEGRGGKQQRLVLREQAVGLLTGLLQHMECVECIDRQPAEAEFQN